MDQQFLAQVKDKMLKAMQVLQEDLGTIRTGRATPALVENIVISAYDNTQHLKIKELATITTEGPRNILISPFDPSIVKDIERGISASNAGLSASVGEGNVIRINIPPLTAERREEFIKLAHTKLEGGRIMVRQVRHETMKDLSQMLAAKEISEDDQKRLEKEVQNYTDEFMAEIESFRERKESELREV